MDTVFIHQIDCKAVIGIHPFERLKPQRLIISVDLYTDIRVPAKSGDINDALNYFDITRFIQKSVAESEFHLIERLAESLAQLLLDTYPMKALKLHLQKPGALEQTQQVGIEIYRERP